ncbi:MAG: leucine-rich repeat domain-containing protein, partial [Duncaniella sp.]|nr:leucine-rich repeat domain-containing protein [Duncaniella sp.]
PILYADFSTLWLASFQAGLTIADLTDASVDGGVVPDDAFYHQNAQLDRNTHEIKTIALEKLYLPDGVTELGASVAWQCANLTEVRLPSTLEIIGRNAFGWCRALTFDRLVFPETLELIASNAFFRTEALSCEVVFPKSLNEIGNEAFAYSSLTGATFTGAVKNIGRQAFAGSGIRKLSLHDGCGFDERIGGQFTDNRYLVEVTLPSDLTTIPYSMFSSCTALERVELPAALETVGEQAFCMTAIENLSLPEGVKTLEANSFSDCANLIEVTLPSTVRSIAGSAFDGSMAIKTIFSLIENPTPENSMYSTSYKDAVVYIPTRTGMAYRNTDGWKEFSYFVEVADGALHYESFKAVTNESDNALTAVNFTFHDAVKVVDGGVVQLWDNDMLSLVKEVPAYVNTLVNCFMVSADFGNVELVADKHYSIVMPEGTVVDEIGQAVSNSRFLVALDVNSGIADVKASGNAR